MINLNLIKSKRKSLGLNQEEVAKAIGKSQQSYSFYENGMNRIKQLREEKGLKRNELASLINANASSITEWEKGRYNPSEVQKIKLCNIFGCTMDYLMGYANTNQATDSAKLEKNKIILTPRNSTNGELEYTVSDQEMKAIITLLNTMKDIPDKDNF